MSDRQYGIIREQGEFMDHKPLNEEDNRIVNEMDKSNSSSSENSKNNK